MKTKSHSLIEIGGILPEFNLELFIKEIFIFENIDVNKKSILPFYADGYPGIIFQEAKNKTILLPRNKELSRFFLYGQTLQPIELSLKGPFQMIVFQLYPFTSKLLFSVDPKKLNDDCYDLSKIETTNNTNPLNKINASTNIDSRIRIIAQFLSKLASEKGLQKFQKLQFAIQLVTDRKGIITVNELAERMKISERTLQRMFNENIGISPKKFAKIIQFQISLTQISQDSFSKLTDVVYENGYADQSHFIRNIKKITGKRPSQLKSGK